MPRWAPAAAVEVLVLALVAALVLAVGAASVPAGDLDASPPAGEVGASPPGPSSRLPAAPSPPSARPSPTPSAAPCPGPGAGGRRALRILTFNIHGGVAKHKRYDLDQVVAEIRTWEPDVVLLQEIHRFRQLSGFDEQPAVLGERLGLEHVFGQNFTRRAKVEGYPRRRTGNAVLSRFPILEHENIALPNRVPLQQRGLLRATLDVAGREVDVWNTHLQPGGTGIRMLQVSAVERHVLERAVQGGRPWLLGGDFNSTPDSAPMLLATSFATDPWPLVGRGVGETVRPRQPRARIDYLLHGPGWRASEARTLLSLVSDHRALQARLVLEADVGCAQGASD